MKRPSFRSIVERGLRAFTGNSNYAIDAAMSDWSLRQVVTLRMTSILRAQWKLLGTKTSWKSFVEAGSTIRGRARFSAGPGLVLEQYAIVNANSRSGVRCGSRVTIGKFSLIEGTGVLSHEADGLRIGNNSSVGDYCFIGTGGGVTVGDNVLMGQRVSIHGENHNFEKSDLLIREQGVRRSGVIIRDDVWIGSGVIILDGVTIGQGAVLAAGSLVTKSVPDYAVVMGAPARIVSERK